ncbi:hypothetical protein TIFTF001_004577 [Ficus carica]|uniref:Uncharacterized protein n=1 Tax=Ficus carica TaxID=3494 RepID=A0AA87ZLB0_FICCA|nr:hypothetical protein TIFTF001_004577 [Ficus carica]
MDLGAVVGSGRLPMSEVDVVGCRSSSSLPNHIFDEDLSPIKATWPESSTPAAEMDFLSQLQGGQTSVSNWSAACVDYSPSVHRSHHQQLGTSTTFSEYSDHFYGVR